MYQHLLAAVVAFVAFETLLFLTGAAEGIYNTVAGSGGAWLLVLGGFMLVGWLATAAAHDLGNPGKQYAGLFGLAAAEALIFAPFLYYVFNVGGGAVTVGAAAVVTALGFAGLTVVGLVTRRDLSFLRPMVLWAGVMALVLIVRGGAVRLRRWGSCSRSPWSRWPARRSCTRPRRSSGPIPRMPTWAQPSSSSPR